MNTQCLRHIDREMRITFKPAGMPSLGRVQRILAALKEPSAPLQCSPTSSNPARPT